MGNCGSTQKKSQNIQKNKEIEENGSNHKIEQNKNNKERIKENYMLIMSKENLKALLNLMKVVIRKIQVFLIKQC